MGKARKPPQPAPESDAPVVDDAPSALRRAGKFLLKAIFRPKRLFLLALIAALGAVSPVIWKHWPDLDDQPTYRVRAADIQITPAPRPVPTNLVERAIGTANLEEDFSILEPGLLLALAEAFASEPWVKRVVRLRKGLPAYIAIDVEYRQPVAMIDVKSGVYPVDEDGILLPPEDFTRAEIDRYPLVTGVRSLPAGGPGEGWEDSTVVGAARIAAAIGSEWEALGLTAIHAPPLETANPSLDDLIYELHTRGGSKVIWGRPPGTGHPGELTADQKIGRLKRYAADFGALGMPGPTFEIDIRPWQEITRRPLVTSDPSNQHRR